MGIISVCVASTNFLQSLLEKEHQVSPQGKRIDQILEALSSGQATSRGTAITTSPQALASTQKTLKALWSLAHEPYSCFVIPYRAVLVRGGRQGIRLGNLLLGIAPGPKAISCMTCWDGVPKGHPVCQKVEQRTPHPQCTPALPGQTEMFTRTALLPVLSQGGGKQDTDSLDVISFTALWASVSLLFFTSSLVHSCS